MSDQTACGLVWVSFNLHLWRVVGFVHKDMQYSLILATLGFNKELGVLWSFVIEIDVINVKGLKA